MNRNAQLRGEIILLARQKPQFGYRRLHALLSRRGYPVLSARISNTFAFFRD